MKTCFKCGARKRLDEFYRHPSMGDGRLGKCKDCAKADARSNYAKRREQYSAYDAVRNRAPERRGARPAYTRNYRRRNPEKARAWKVVAWAVHSGRLVKPDACQRCGRGKPQAHHSDYSRPLDVEWLCFACHREHGHGQVVTAKDAG